MLIRKSPDIPSSEITPKADYLSRRTFMTGIAAAGVTALAAERVTRWAGTVHAAEKLQTVKSPLSLKGETLDFAPGHYSLQQLLRVRD